MSFMLAFYNHHREQFHLTGLFNKQESKMGGGGTKDVKDERGVKDGRGAMSKNKSRVLTHNNAFA